MATTKALSVLFAATLAASALVSCGGESDTGSAESAVAETTVADGVRDGWGDTYDSPCGRALDIADDVYSGEIAGDAAYQEAVVMQGILGGDDSEVDSDLKEAVLAFRYDPTPTGFAAYGEVCDGLTVVTLETGEKVAVTDELAASGSLDAG